MKIAAAVFAAVLVLLPAGPAHADDDDPRGNDTGCCFSFDNSPVNLVFCTVPGACRF